VIWPRWLPPRQPLHDGRGRSASWLLPPARSGRIFDYRSRRVMRDLARRPRPWPLLFGRSAFFERPRRNRAGERRL